MAPNIRDAERKRTSTCTFADRIASTALSEYTGYAEHELFKEHQTVLAAFLLHDTVADDLQVVSFGVGTKFMSEGVMNGKDSGACVRDCHAEVLARRAFVRFLYLQMRNVVLSEERGSEAGGVQQVLKLCSGGLFEWRPRFDLLMYCSAMPCGNATIRRWAKGRTEAFHDSVPQNRPPAALLRHPSITLHAKSEGQVQPLVKKDPAAGGCGCQRMAHGCAGPSSHPSSTAGPSRDVDAVVKKQLHQVGASAVPGAAGAVQELCANKRRECRDTRSCPFDQSAACTATAEADAQPAEDAAGTCSNCGGTHTRDRTGRGTMRQDSSINGNVPAGCAAVASGMGSTACCSDKIARWNVLGVQGAAAMRLLAQPLYLASITIGHKFSRPHACRALCCRLQGFDEEWRRHTTATAKACAGVCEPSEASGCSSSRREMPWHATACVPAEAASGKRWHGDAAQGGVGGVGGCHAPSAARANGCEGSAALGGSSTAAQRVAPQFALNHPAILCTSVRFDKGVYRTDGAVQAVFQQLCLCWCRQGGGVEVLDGSTGMPCAAVGHCTGPDSMQGCGGHAQHHQVLQDVAGGPASCGGGRPSATCWQGGPQAAAAYQRQKSACEEYVQAREVLCDCFFNLMP